MKPKRIQLSRKKGWRKPPNTIVVARPSRWGNPWRIGARLLRLTGKKAGEEFTVTPEIAVKFFRSNLTCVESLRAVVRRELGGKNLACWCKPGTPCHADVLLEVANEATR